MAFLGAMAISFSIIESMVPKPLPWMRIGLANAIMTTIVDQSHIFPLNAVHQVNGEGIIHAQRIGMGFEDDL